MCPMINQGLNKVYIKYNIQGFYMEVFKHVKNIIQGFREYWKIIQGLYKEYHRI